MENKVEVGEDSPLLWTRNYAIQKFCQQPIYGLIALAGGKEVHAEFEKILVQGLRDCIWKPNPNSAYARPQYRMLSLDLPQTCPRVTKK